MKKTIWLTLLIALIVVNALAMAAEAYSDLIIPMPYRLAIVLAISLVTLVFCGAWQLMRGAESETPSSHSQTTFASHPEHPEQPPEQPATSDTPSRAPY